MTMERGKMKAKSPAIEIYKTLESYGVPSEKTLDCANELIKPFSSLLDYAVKIGYKPDELCKES